MARTYHQTVTTPAAAAASQRGRPPFVSLLSDFGLRDPSAGIMRAVVAGICPEAVIVDLAHEVDKFAIRDGALLLWSAVPFLPVGVHVAVVDPGVGTARKGIAIQVARGDFLVGPDNGLLMPAAARLGGITSVHLLEDPRYALPEVSSSFHGRDLFAPAGAHLAAGVPIEELGRAVDPRRLADLAWPRPEIRPDHLRAQAIYLDSFGNVKLSALTEDIEAAMPGLGFGDELMLRAGAMQPDQDLDVTWARTFGDVPKGAALLTADSYGRVALSVHQGSAAERFGISLDSIVDIGRKVPAASPPPGPPPPPPPPPPGTPPPGAPPPPPGRAPRR
jgi:S-adenosylmethionine hydrolase